MVDIQYLTTTTSRQLMTLTTLSAVATISDLIFDLGSSSFIASSKPSITPSSNNYKYIHWQLIIIIQ